jgi:Zn-finger nucleic acid-binding protein
MSEWGEHDYLIDEGWTHTAMCPQCYMAVKYVTFGVTFLIDIARCHECGCVWCMNCEQIITEKELLVNELKERIFSHPCIRD